MRRILSASILLFVVSVASLALAPSAHAGIRLSGTLKGEDVLPEAARFLTDVEVWKQRARFDHEQAQMRGDWNRARAIERAWAQKEKEARDAWESLKAARTRVVLYGDAAQRLQAPDVVRQLRATGSWIYATVHFWYQRGELFWGLSAPRGGYDNSATLQSQAPHRGQRTQRHPDDRGPTRRFDWSAEGRKRRMSGSIFGL